MINLSCHNSTSLFTCYATDWCLFCFDCFTSDQQTVCSLFKIRLRVIECVNYDLVIGLFSELLMRLTDYIHTGYGNKWLISHGDRTRVLTNVNRHLYPWTRALTFMYHWDTHNVFKTQIKLK